MRQHPGPRILRGQNVVRQSLIGGYQASAAQASSESESSESSPPVISTSPFAWPLV